MEVVYKIEITNAEFPEDVNSEIFSFSIFEKMFNTKKLKISIVGKAPKRNIIIKSRRKIPREVWNGDNVGDSWIKIEREN